MSITTIDIPSLSHHISQTIMATAAVLSPHNVDTTLNYYAPIGDEAPFQYVFDPPAGTEKTNIGADPHPATVHDARGKQSEFTLDNAGFQFINHVSSEKEFFDDEKIADVYYKEVEELLKKHTGGKRVFIFDHTIRFAPITFHRQRVSRLTFFVCRRSPTDAGRGTQVAGSYPVRGPVVSEVLILIQDH